MAHPHPNKRHLMLSYRRFVLGAKTKYAGSKKPTPGHREPHRIHRGVAHYLDYVHEYLEAKRDVVAGCSCTGGTDICCPVHGTRATADPELIASVDAFFEKVPFLDEGCVTTLTGRKRFFKASTDGDHKASLDFLIQSLNRRVHD